MKNDVDHNQGSLIPSATIILRREQGGALEKLLLRRKTGNDPFAGAGSFLAAPSKTPMARSGTQWPSAARRAAVRELREEAGLEVFSPNLVPYSCWTSPVDKCTRLAL